ncbi:hypothetical protein Tco_1548214 [Tanacetum coccineum]
MHKLNIYSITRVLFILPRYGINSLSKFSPETELVLYPLQDKLTSGDKSLDLSAFKLSRLFFSLLSSESSSCWRLYEVQVSHDAVMLRVFPITLTGAAKRYVDRLPLGTVDSWDLLKKPLSRGTFHHQRLPSSLMKSTTLSRKETRHYTKLGSGPIHGMTPAQALTAIQTMADHSQKWHDGSSNRNIESSSNSKGIASDVSKLDNLGRDMMNLKENVHAIQVGCQNCRGAHLDKDCPLNEEVKSVEEAKYGEFGRSGAKYLVGPPGYFTRIDNRPPFEEKRPSLEELMNKHLEESTRRRAKMEEWVKKLQENAKINTQNQSASLKNLETQIEQLIKEFHTKAANEINNSSSDQCKAVYTDKKTCWELKVSTSFYCWFNLVLPR